MNLNFLLDCNVCKTKYLIKHQIGYRSTEFYFECPTCGIMLSGKVNINNETTRISQEFQNLTESNSDENPDYFIQLSGEFYDNKLVKGDASSRFIPGSFISNSFIGYEKMKKLSKWSQYIIEGIPQLYSDCANVIDLIISKKNNEKYVFSEMIKLHEDTQEFLDFESIEEDFLTSYNNQVDSLLFKSVCVPFRPLIDINKNHFVLSKSRDKLKYVFENNLEEFRNQIEEFDDVIGEVITSIVSKIKAYIELLPKLTPLITSEILDIYNIEDIKKSKGLNTVDYNELLTNYADIYEILGRYISFKVAVDNVINRGSVVSFVDNDYRTFRQFHNDSVGNKLNHLKKISNDELKYMDLSILNNKIRNSINHYSYVYDSLEQKIVFKDRSRSIEMYLVEFANDNYKMLFLLIEALYTLCSIRTKFKSTQ